MIKSEDEERNPLKTHIRVHSQCLHISSGIYTIFFGQLLENGNSGLASPQAKPKVKH